mmetsp:Transcript_8323/g.22248  ORF Transcript_8323/g.22248 Transcript_8323/m.22248 type:complete len:382 (-) Transcript_8323:47-1192(-)
MKLLAAGLAMATRAVDGSRVRARSTETAILQGFSSFLNSTGLQNVSLFGARGAGGALGSQSRPPRYGSPRCPCIGIDDLDGTTNLRVAGETVSYPADVGGRCDAWDEGTNPMCKGGGDLPDFCHQAWCYVDPCNCDIEIPPKPTTYMEGAKYQGRPVHWSYHTCSATDSWSLEHNQKQPSPDEIKAMCAKPPDTRIYGKDSCRCIGIDGQEGQTMVKVGGKMQAYPADVGASCSAWDDGRHPNCTGNNAPPWCKQSWCYVDPCLCKERTPPKESTYVEEGVFGGRPMYYSYTACRSEDYFVESQGDTACTQYKDKKSCEHDDNERWCKWEDERGVCLGMALTVVCGEVGGNGGMAHGAAARPVAGTAALAAVGAAGALLLF